MRAHAYNRRLGFQCTRDVQHILSKRLVRPPRIEISEHPGDSLDAKHSDVRKAGLLELNAQILRAMEVGRREVIECVRRIPMLSVDQILVANSKECGIEYLAREPIERGRIPRNCGDRDGARRGEHAMRLPKRGDTIA